MRLKPGSLLRPGRIQMVTPSERAARSMSGGKGANGSERSITARMKATSSAWVGCIQHGEGFQRTIRIQAELHGSSLYALMTTPVIDETGT